jgi:hypothetical protein
MADEKKTEEQESALEGGFDQDQREAAYKEHDERIAKDPEFTPVEKEDELADTELVAGEEDEEEPEEKEETTEEEPKDAEVDEPTEEEPVTIKVDGEEMQVTQAEVEGAGGVENLQKLKAADKRLQEATLKLKRAELMEQRMAQMPTQAPTNDAAAPPVGDLPAKAPDEIRTRMMEIDRKIAVEGVATEEEFQKLQTEKMQLQDEYFQSKFNAQQQYNDEVARQRAMAEASEHLVRTVSGKYPTYMNDMFLLDETGQQIPDPKRPGMAALNPKFEKFLEDKPPKFAEMALDSMDEKDVSYVLDQFYGADKPMKAGSLAEKREKKKTIDTPETSKAKTATKKKKAKDLGDDTEYVKTMKRDRAKGEYAKPTF